MEIYSHDNGDQLFQNLKELKNNLYCTRLCNKGAHSFCVAACFECAQIAQQKLIKHPLK